MLVVQIDMVGFQIGERVLDLASDVGRFAVWYPVVLTLGNIGAEVQSAEFGGEEDIGASAGFGEPLAQKGLTYGMRVSRL